MGMSGRAFRKMIERHPLPQGIVVRIGSRRRIDIYAFEKWVTRQQPRGGS